MSWSQVWAKKVEFLGTPTRTERTAPRAKSSANTAGFLILTTGSCKRRSAQRNLLQYSSVFLQRQVLFAILQFASHQEAFFLIKICSFRQNFKVRLPPFALLAMVYVLFQITALLRRRVPSRTPQTNATIVILSNPPGFWSKQCGPKACLIDYNEEMRHRLLFQGCS